MTTLAEKIYNKIHNKNGKQQVFVDPATLMLIMTIVSGIFKMWQECKKKKEEALQVAHNPTLREKRTLKRHIRRNLGRQKYQEEGDLYYNAVLDEGRTAVLEDIVDGYRETIQLDKT